MSLFSFVEIDLAKLLSTETLEFHKESLQEREKFRMTQKQKEQELDKLMPQKYFRNDVKFIARRLLTTLKKLVQNTSIVFR